MLYFINTHQLSNLIIPQFQTFFNITAKIEMGKVHFYSLARKCRLASFLSRRIVYRVRKGCQARNFAFGENSLALRLTSELVDLRAAKPNRILRVSAQSSVRWRSGASNAKRTPEGVLALEACWQKRCLILFRLFLNLDIILSRNQAFCLLFFLVLKQFHELPWSFP